MTDPKRLPVLLLNENHVNSLPVVYGMTIGNMPAGNVWAIDITSKPLQLDGMVRYEPVVPRCATCNCFSPLPTDTGKALCSLSLRTQPWWIPSDGSGYCHEHPEAKR